MKKELNKLKTIAIGTLLLATIGMTSAQTSTSTKITHKIHQAKKTIVSKKNNPINKSIKGTITAINGSVLAISEETKNNSSTTSPTIYTVDASSSKITKAGATTTLSVSDLILNEKVLIIGTISGTDISAKSIHIIDNQVKVKKTAAKKAIKKNKK